MDKKEWKAKAKSLKKQLEKLASDGTAAVGAVVEEVVEAVKKAAKPVSPLAPASFPALPRIAGAEFAAAEAGVKYLNRKDVMLVRLAPGTVIAGAFTRSSTRSGCVRDCQTKLAAKVPAGAGAAIVVNSGNSNAFTGAVGDKAVAEVTGGVAAALGLPASRVFSSSTGVIGEPLPYEKITAVIPALTAALTEDAIEMAAHAIMTTDTFPKGAAATVEGEGGTIHISGIAKGSGMIAPDMATMLVYIFTDAKIPAAALQKIVSRNVGETFNSITVDSDTSTSDTLLVAATGQSAAAEVKGATAKAFETALRGVMMSLAHQVIRDGEGATKFVEVRVTGAASPEDAQRVALSVANSPLVKTAIAGEDPNWGRIVAAVGKSGAEADRDRLSIRFGDILVARNGWRNPAYREEDGAAYMRQSELVIGVDLGLGKAKRSVWTCDLTNRYIEINADYRS
ncbi:bifunctional glutamate N-acetyltransferase/amino-acid acetyltransferase ArgJ [Tabrizicola fusiformis]|uniref:bifunctional glutamate N-acetyltransferase/amino-acid acetyltransferase ArgJ n=1 Tax=Tabrizicola sp. SY72 TaxID=2741673 RepID=UPI001574CC78|nr:bifunctional glutamate N-acetyltransferase/amino-acid acetyltransferase ArgJ [Tabrizicola sp. SY72]NTT86998.1 bifunctional glutamate N-acetyltransferase/amino-acid acetyltransferase ArgJ [Tabrizicola sp. SY72]